MKPKRSAKRKLALSLRRKDHSGTGLRERVHPASQAGGLIATLVEKIKRLVAKSANLVAGKKVKNVQNIHLVVQPLEHVKKGVRANHGVKNPKRGRRNETKFESIKQTNPRGPRRGGV